MHTVCPKTLAPLIIAFAIATGGDAAGAELRLMVTNGAKPIIAEIASQFEQ